MAVSRVLVGTINFSETQSNTITDLTGTTWVIDEEPVLAGANTDFYINFTSNSTNYAVLSSSGTTSGVLRYISYDGNSYSVTPALTIMNTNLDNLDEPPVYQYTWSDQAYRTITITGGTDATNTDLIAWLQANATLQEEPTSSIQVNNCRAFIKKQSITTNASCITNLVGTTWEFNNSLTTTTISYNIQGNVHNNEYINYDFTSFNYDNSYGVDIFSFYYSTITAPYTFGDGFIYLPQEFMGYSTGWYFGNTNDPTSYVSTNPPIITITGGDDATNSNLISFLWENATLTSISNVRGKTFILNENFDNMPLETVGQHNIYFTNSNISGTCSAISYSKYYDSVETKTQMYIKYYYNNGSSSIQPYNLFATNSGWYDQSYRAITILDSENINPLSSQDYGADSDTVAFFQNYAQLGTLTTILQPVALAQKVASSGTITDLTNTTWEFNATSTTMPVPIPTPYGTSLIGTLTTPDNTIINIVNYETGEMTGDIALLDENDVFYEFTRAGAVNRGSSLGTYTLHITSGNLTTNTTLINALTTYWTQVGGVGLQPLAIGYTSEPPAGYNVTITFQNGVDTSAWQSTKIYKNYTTTVIDGKNYPSVNSSDEIGSISSANGTSIVTTNTDKIFILSKSSSLTETYGNISVSSTITTTGYQSQLYSGTHHFTASSYVLIDNVSEGLISYYIIYEFSVSGDGTITISGADWED